MYRIGICDDAESVCASLKEMISRAAHANIVLFHMSGIEAGEFIRNYLEDRKMQIVYISEQPSHALDLFRTQPLEMVLIHAPLPMRLKDARLF